MGVLVLLEARVAAGLELEVAKLEIRRELLAGGERMAGDSAEPHPPVLARPLAVGARLDTLPAKGGFVDRDAGLRHPATRLPALRLHAAGGRAARPPARATGQTSSDPVGRAGSEARTAAGTARSCGTGPRRTASGRSPGPSPARAAWPRPTPRSRPESARSRAARWAGGRQRSRASRTGPASAAGCAAAREVCVPRARRPGGWRARSRRRARAAPARGARTRSARAGVPARSRPRAAPLRWRRRGTPLPPARPRETEAPRASVRARGSRRDPLPVLLQRVHRHLAERLLLSPGELALLVELEQGVDGNRHRHPVRLPHGFLEAEAPLPQKLAQVRQALRDGHLRHRDVAYVDPLGRLEQLADRLAEDGWVVDGASFLERRPAQRGRQRRRTEPVRRLALQPLPQGLGRSPIALGIEQARQQLLGRLARV